MNDKNTWIVECMLDRATSDFDEKLRAKREEGNKENFGRNPGKIARQIVQCFPVSEQYNQTRFQVAFAAMMACAGPIEQVVTNFWDPTGEFLPRTLGEMNESWKTQVFNIFMDIVV